jgi:hypothetical protein
MNLAEQVRADATPGAQNAPRQVSAGTRMCLTIADADE